MIIAGKLYLPAVQRSVSDHLVAATGPFQRPIIPAVVPESAGIHQIHSNHYRNPAQLPKGAVLVIGAGSSGAQIADELLRSGKRVYLAVGPHERPPAPIAARISAGGWACSVTGTPRRAAPGMEHVTISVSGARGGHTVDFREFASRGMTLLGGTLGFADGVMTVAPDLIDRQGRRQLSVRARRGRRVYRRPGSRPARRARSARPGASRRFRGTLFDECFDFGGGLSCRLRQSTYLDCHHSKTPAGLTGARGLH